jgi:hypothetical protein
VIRSGIEKARRKPRFLFLALALSLPAPVFAACDFPTVRKEIDNVLDQDKQKSAEFRKQMASGSDSLYVMEKMVAASMREKLDECRFEAGEYLTKRGFPPAH